MIDERIKKVARILIEHSLNIKKDDLFLISGSPVAAPLISEVYDQALQKGAHPHVRLGLESLSEIYYSQATHDQLQYISPLDEFEIQHIDARLSIISPENTRYMSTVDPNKQAVRSRSQQPLHNMFLKRAASGDLRWCVTMFPTNAAAQDAEMSLRMYEDFVYRAAQVQEPDPILFWKNMEKKQRHIQEILGKKETIRIIADDTDISFNVKERKWISCFGKENFPDGEIFTGPLEDSTEGYIHFSFPLVYGGRRVDDVKLWFKEGVVVKATAANGLDFLESMIQMDDGSKRLGELAFGTNYGINVYTKNILFDEKIGGTMHIALGSGYPETGSSNTSGLHWDMVIDLRKAGRVVADDEIIFKNGIFVV
ncbi:MAG: aminopeptidase [Candidatus Thermoplasmatota archaeon]|nr:aminopeptidase [Candidatus Thermoplasmatota archaeon]